MAKTRERFEEEIRTAWGCEDLKVIDVLTPYQGRRRVLCYDSSAVKKWIIAGEDAAWYFDTEEEARSWRRYGNRKPRPKEQARA